ncbi:hypothetical protein GCM10010321_23060 [Streptomyces chartreusis]|nr:hypothetical protein GCM10010321_23060 [Streptomyces chartreusis]
MTARRNVVTFGTPPTPIRFPLPTNRIQAESISAWTHRDRSLNRSASLALKAPQPYDRTEPPSPDPEITPAKVDRS